MTNTLMNSENLAPANGEANDNLQNNSGDNTQPENAEPRNGSGRRHYRKDNRLIADLKRTLTQKNIKNSRLQSEIDKYKADLERGYLIVPLGDDSRAVKHLRLNKADKKTITAAIWQREFEKYELGLDISELEMRISQIASAKTSSYRDKLSKKKKEKNENDLVKRIVGALDKASKNGSKDIVSQMQQQAQSGDKNEAYQSLKSFLAQEVKTVAKKLGKSSELEHNVIGRVFEKLSVSQS